MATQKIPGAAKAVAKYGAKPFGTGLGEKFIMNNGRVAIEYGKTYSPFWGVAAARISKNRAITVYETHALQKQDVKKIFSQLAAYISRLGLAKGVKAFKEAHLSYRRRRTA